MTKYDTHSAHTLNLPSVHGKHGPPFGPVVPVKVCFCQYVRSQLSNITFAHAKSVYLEDTVMRTSQSLCFCIFLVRKMDNQHCLKYVLKKSSMS